MRITREYKEMGGDTVATLEVPDGYEAPPRIDFPVYEVSGRLGKRTFVRQDPGVWDKGELEARVRAVEAASRVGDYEVWSGLLADLQGDVLAAMATGEFAGDEGRSVADTLFELAKDRPVREGRQTDGG